MAQRNEITPIIVQLRNHQVTNNPEERGDPQMKNNMELAKWHMKKNKAT